MQRSSSTGTISKKVAFVPGVTLKRVVRFKEPMSFEETAIARKQALRDVEVMFRALVEAEKAKLS